MINYINYGFKMVYFIIKKVNYNKNKMKIKKYVKLYLYKINLSNFINMGMVFFE